MEDGILSIGKGFYQHLSTFVYKPNKVNNTVLTKYSTQHLSPTRGLSLKIVCEYDQEILNHNLNCRQPRDIVKKSHTTITRHQEDKQSKSTSSILSIKVIAKLEWTQSNARQNIVQLQNPTMGVTINNESTETEHPP